MSSRFLAGVVFAFIAVAPLEAQVPAQFQPPQGHMSREALTRALAHLEEITTSYAYTSADRARAQHEAALIRVRLQDGDFQVGDRIFMVVEGEAALSDTFAVAPGRVLNLPGLAPVTVAGVLRYELQDHLRQELGRYLRDPVVRARSMIRLAITGEVASQGFFVMPTDMVLSDALMLAGGPSSDARLDGVRIMRGREVLWTVEATGQAMREGRTLDQLNLRAGDQVIVPAKGGGLGGIARALPIIMPLITLVAALVL